MKTITAFKLGIIALAMMMAATCAYGQGKDGGGRLAGTWDTVVTIRNCTTGGAIVSFQSVGSFNQGGTFSGITSGMPPNLRSSERGVWQHGIGSLYRFRFKAYVFNAAGAPTGYQVITHDLELNDDATSWSSEGVNQVFDMTGTQTGAGCSTATATRMTLD